MRILLVGCGFIGHHIAQRFYEDHELHVINRSNLSLERNEFIRDGQFGLIGNYYQEDAARNRLPWLPHEFDTIIYTASTSAAHAVKDDPELGTRSIMYGPVNIAKTYRHKQFVYLSSSMVYGNFQDDVPVHEMVPLNPIEPYGIMKAASEELLKFYTPRWIIVRPSAVYGPRDRVERVISKFLYEARMGRPLHINGATDALDFTYVDDLVDGIVKIVEQQVLNQTFNLTYGTARTIVEAAQIVAGFYPGTKIVIKEREALYPKRGALSIVAAKKVIGYEPKVSLEEGIQRYHDSLH